MNSENKKIKYLKECYDAEIARRKNVEQKASIYIGTLGVVGTILANGLVMLVQDSGKLPVFITFVCLIFIVLITISMAVSSYYAIGAALKKDIFLIDPKDVKEKYSDSNVEEKLCDDYYDATTQNYDITNKKVDCMNSAQQWMRIAVILFATFAFFLLAYFTVSHYGDIIKSVMVGWKSVKEVNDCLTIISLMIGVIALICSIIAFVKIHSLSESLQKLKSALRNSIPAEGAQVSPEEASKAGK